MDNQWKCKIIDNNKRNAENESQMTWGWEMEHYFSLRSYRKPHWAGNTRAEMWRTRREQLCHKEGKEYSRQRQRSLSVEGVRNASATERKGKKSSEVRDGGRRPVTGVGVWILFFSVGLEAIREFQEEVRSMISFTVLENYHDGFWGSGLREGGVEALRQVSSIARAPIMVEVKLGRQQ